MLLPKAEPIVSLYAQKWGVSSRDILGECRERRVVYARAEVARVLWNIGYNNDQIKRLLRKDRTTIIYYLGLTKRAIPIGKGTTIMAKRKLTDAQRAELGRLHDEGGYRASKLRAAELGVSHNYGAILAQRAAHTIAERARQKKLRPRKISEENRKKWDRAIAAGPVNTGAES